MSIFCVVEARRGEREVRAAAARVECHPAAGGVCRVCRRPHRLRGRVDL